MKTIFALMITALSFSSFGLEMGAVDSLLSVLPLGEYSGANDLGEACSVLVKEVNYPEKSISVTVSNKQTNIFRIVNDGEEFRFRAYKQEFIQTKRQYIDASRNSYQDKIIRTVGANDNKLYVVVANDLMVNGTYSSEAMECVIGL